MESGLVELQVGVGEPYRPVLPHTLNGNMAWLYPTESGFGLGGLGSWWHRYITRGGTVTEPNPLGGWQSASKA